MFSTDFTFRQQENLVDNQKCFAGFRPLFNKILVVYLQKRIYQTFISSDFNINFVVNCKFLRSNEALHLIYKYFSKIFGLIYYVSGLKFFAI